MKEGLDPQETDTEFHPTLVREAGGVVAVNKPAGLATQAPPGLPSAEAWLRRRVGPGGYVGVPHRLDRAVSGVLLLTTTPRAARRLSRQFERREISKTYLALLAMQAEAGVDGSQVWRDCVAKVPDEPRVRIVRAGEPGAREAETRVRILDRPEPGVLLVSFEPLTGRMHQLRVQAAARGLPILGDTLYGAAEWPAPASRHADPRRRAIALHAWRIAYADPDTGAAIRVEVPAPAGWPTLSGPDDVS